MRAAVRLGLGLSLILGFCGFGSCAITVQDLCSQKIPDFRHSLEVALADLSAPGRSPASAQSAPPPDWTLWSEEKLLEIQRHRDAMEGEGAFVTTRDLLSKIADDLVTFHGYSERDRTPDVRHRMQATLRRIESKTEKLRRQACIAPL